MALIVQRIVDGGVHAEEALGGRCRLEPLHLALAPSHGLVGSKRTAGDTALDAHAERPLWVRLAALRRNTR